MNKTGEIVLYKKPDGTSAIDVRFDGDTIWLNQNQIANLFDVKTPAINKHLNNIFNEGELKKSSTISKMEIVQIEGKRQVKRFVEFYNLDAIISVGYRVKGRGTQNDNEQSKKTKIFFHLNFQNFGLFTYGRKII